MRTIRRSDPLARACLSAGVIFVMSCAGGGAPREEVSYGQRSSGGDVPTTVTTPAQPAQALADPSEGEIDAALALAVGDPGRPAALMRAAERIRLRVASSARSEAQTQALGHIVRGLRAVVEQHPSYPRCDEAAFRMGLAAETMGRMDDGRRAYLLLIQRFPTSRFVSHAYLRFAEYFRAQEDHDSSRQFYDHVARQNADPALAAYAYFRVGRAHAASSNCAAAMQALQRAQSMANAPSEVVSAANADLAALGRCAQPTTPLADSDLAPPAPPLSSESELGADTSSPP